MKLRPSAASSYVVFISSAMGVFLPLPYIGFYYIEHRRKLQEILRNQPLSQSSITSRAVAGVTLPAINTSNSI